MLEILSGYLTDSHLWAFLVALPFIVTGFVGSILPVIPGTVVILAGFFLYGFITGFDTLGLFFYTGQAILTAVSYLVDFLAAAFGVKVYGGSKAAVWGAVFGSLMVFIIGPVGILIGPLSGAVAGELIAGEELKQSCRSGVGTLVGFVGGSLANLLVCSIMTFWFIWEIF